ncbi:MAG: GGDEF domain-containing protein, partial [Acidimicrobiales bacterium]
MGYVAGIIIESTDTGDWSRCTPEECELVLDSADDLGEAAGSFNGLLHALAHSRQSEQALAGFSRSLVQHLEVDDVAEAALDGFITHSGAEAGALGVVRNGEIVIEAAFRIDGVVVEQSVAVRLALRDARAMAIPIPEGLVVDASLLSFRPRQLVVVPLRFKSVPVGVVLLAFAREASPEVIRLLNNLGNPCGVALNNSLSHERLQHLAAIDPLTGIYNRRFGDGRLVEEWGRAVRDHSPLGLISFDSDHFKGVNDIHGHLAGDRVL